MPKIKEGDSIGETTVSVEKPKQIVPWGLHPIYPWIFDQLKSRAQEYDFNIDPSKAYAGPRTAWTRVFSNGISSREVESVKGGGFVMGGAETFNESYGFNPDKKITIGVDSRGNPHEIDAVIGDSSNLSDDFPHRPPPSVVSVTSEFSGAAGNAFTALCKKTTISWRCYSLNQLNYLIPYFLTPRISLIIEWGWNNYDISSLIDLTDLEGMKKIWSGEYDATVKRIENSKGNYDFAMGMIVDYGYRLAEDGGYDCTTTIMNPNFMIGGQAYQDGTVEKKNPDGTKTKLQDFIEFANFELGSIKGKISKKIPTVQKIADNLIVDANTVPYTPPITTNPTDDDILIPIENKQVFTSGNNTWLRMDLVANIINAFFEKRFVDEKGNRLDIGITKLDIDTHAIPVCAHPALKSTNENILVPNAAAPRFATSDKESKNKGSIPSVDTYNSLFPNVQKIIKENKYTDEYDNIQEAMGAERSFPVYDKEYSSTSGTVSVGYYGYLKDIYISTSLLQTQIKNNDTVQKLLEAILSSIGTALCGLPQLKLISNNNNSAYSIEDFNFTAVNTPRDAEKLKRINVNSAESAFMRSARFDIKISPEMISQMIMLSAKNAPLNKPIAQVTYDAKIMRFDPTSEGDRFFSRAEPAITTPSITSNESTKGNTARLFTADSTDGSMFVVVTKTTTGDGTATAAGVIAAAAAATNPSALQIVADNTAKQKVKSTRMYIIAEKSSDFLKNILIDIDNKRAVYLNNGIMPGTEFHAEFLGIGGITYLSQFTLDHVPSTYNYKNAVWQIADVKHKIENKMWTTSIMAQARPLTILNNTKSTP